MDLTATVYAPPRAKSPWTIASLYAPSAARFYGFGRHALADALRLAGAPGGRVLLPSFICRDLLASAAAVGAEPAFYAVGPDLAPAEDPGRWPAAAAVLAVDYFGFPQDLAPFQAYARRTGATLIEDAAHALFSRDAAGRLLGTRAPLGILSPRKSLPLPNGGALLVGEPRLAARVPPQVPFAPAAGRRAALKSAARPLLALAGARAAHAGLSALRALRGATDAHTLDPGSERVLPVPAVPCAELGRPLACADPAVEASRRRALWSFCGGIARRAGLAPVFAFLPEGVVPYGYAFRTNAPVEAAAPFSAEGLRVLPWPDLPDAVRSAAPDHHRNVALVHFLW